MESLYVCLFSTGLIKVGRSIDPEARIAAHADRVGCTGIQLSEQFVVECVGPASPREARLIQQCAEAASERFSNEWFAGLDFLAVCDWAKAAAEWTESAPEASQPLDSFGARLRAARLAAGLTQTQLAQGLAFNGGDMNKAATSSWELNNNWPSVPALRLICLRLNISADELLGLPIKARA